MKEPSFLFENPLRSDEELDAMLAKPMPSSRFLSGSRLLMTGGSPAEIMRKALEVLRDPRRLSRRHTAETRYGEFIASYETRAVRWSIGGAVAMASNYWGVLPPYFAKLLDEMAEKHYHCSLEDINNHFAHNEVVYFLELVVEDLEEFE